MKKYLAIIISLIFIVSLFPANTFAMEKTLAELINELSGLTTRDPESPETPETVEAQPEGSLSSKELYNMSAPKVLDIITYDKDGDEYAGGSGFFIDNKGTLVTNFHVIEDAYSATATTSDDVVYKVDKVLGYDTILDLAVLKIDIKNNPYMVISTRPVETGDTVYTLGSSLGLAGTFSDGMVSTASRIIDGVDYIQITAPISSGNSGGPLINTYGEVIGVNTMCFIDGQNLNFSINIKELEKVDVTKDLTMAEFYALDEHLENDNIDPTYDDSDPDVQEWYIDSDYIEVEDNDSMENADTLHKSTYMTGSLPDLNDMDVYEITALKKSDFYCEIVTLYESDEDYILCGLYDADDNLLDIALPDEADDITFLSMNVQLEKAGKYYLYVLLDDEYPYETPDYYSIWAEW